MSGDGQETVRSALAALKEELDAARPRDHEPDLRAAFRVRPKAPGRRRPWLAAAALLLAAGGLWLWQRRADGTAEEHGEIIFALRPGEPDLEGGQVVRVRLSAAALRGLGLASASDLPLAEVEADVLVGYDGVARAVRLASKD